MRDNSTADRVFAAWRSLRRGSPRRASLALYHQGSQRLEPGQIDVLDLVMDEGPVAMNDLAKGLDVDPSTATRAVDRLVRRALLAREPDPIDARLVRIRVTAEGLATCRRYRRQRARYLQVVLEDFTEAELEAGAIFMERLVAGVGRALVAEDYERPAVRQSPVRAEGRKKSPMRRSGSIASKTRRGSK